MCLARRAFLRFQRKVRLHLTISYKCFISRSQPANDLKMFRILKTAPARDILLPGTALLGLSSSLESRLSGYLFPIKIKSIKAQVRSDQIEERAVNSTRTGSRAIGTTVWCDNKFFT